MRSVKLLRLYLIFANIESLFSLLMVFAIPGDSKNALILGFSSARLLLGAFLLAILGGVSWLNLKCLASEEFTKTLLNLVKIIVQRKFVWRLVIGGFASLVLIGLSYFFIITVSNDDPYQSILVRLAPLTLLITLISCQTLLVFPRVFLWPEDRTVIEYKILFNGLIAFVVLLFIIGGMAITGIGIQPPRNSWEFGWGDPAVPILTGQGLMAFGLGITYLAISTVGLRFLKRIRLSLSFIDLAFCLGIWGIGALLWTNQPFTTNWFAPAPRPPNFEHYPYSDAFTHDVIGQNVLIGEGLKWADHRIPRRPLYGLLLATLHFMIGQDYDRVIQWQIFVLALFPVGIYLIGAKLHHRATGVVGSVLVILRERNAIELSGTINVSHAKLMMSDLPTAVLVCGFTFLCILWLQNPKNYKNWPLLIGGLLGVTMLFRTQTVMLGVVPLLVSLAFLKKGESFLPWRKNTLILFAGILLVISPWLWRNWKITGGLIFDETNSQIGMIARRLSISPEDFDSNPRLGENEAS